ncbi:hypothetical protein Sfum_2861 [Syntrophobacter fumaroxidans MPOB]|uniref:Uncharacterized protein n=1 Tax=Syntrophobacter fumaroxidans (strain DSM 10017 / MPOB) TaxID=335543 RepID=A0LM86_SYNFM|nr:hypothetical protein Sfum_2861 [Syntrophobacter fumaroxidans MPOB]
MRAKPIRMLNWNQRRRLAKNCCRDEDAQSRATHRKIKKTGPCRPGGKVPTVEAVPASSSVKPIMRAIVPARIRGTGSKGENNRTPECAP